MTDLAYTLGALFILALGVVASRACLRAERRPTPSPSDLRHRQMNREADESEPITWRR